MKKLKDDIFEEDLSQDSRTCRPLFSEAIKTLSEAAKNKEPWSDRLKAQVSIIGAYSRLRSTEVHHKGLILAAYLRVPALTGQDSLESGNSIENILTEGAGIPAAEDPGKNKND